MTLSSQEVGSQYALLLAAARDYLDGMMYADDAKLRRAFHPKCHVVGHFRCADWGQSAISLTSDF
jgi:hypothetical protein